VNINMKKFNKKQLKKNTKHTEENKRNSERIKISRDIDRIWKD